MNTETKIDAGNEPAHLSNETSFQVNWRRRFLLLVAVWICAGVLMSFPVIRGMVAYPLYVHDADAHGDMAYVMADGHATWERLRAAADLYHQKRVPQIMILDESEPAGYNYVRGKLDTRTERSIDYLKSYGVPEDRITLLSRDSTSWMSSFGEACDVARQAPDLKRLVVVTSAPHTRRSRMCFRRSQPEGVSVQVYAATNPRDSVENSAPIWLEYAKLLIYFFAAK